MEYVFMIVGVVLLVVGVLMIADRVADDLSPCKYIPIGSEWYIQPSNPYNKRIDVKVLGTSKEYVQYVFKRRETGEWMGVEFADSDTCEEFLEKYTKADNLAKP